VNKDLIERFIAESTICQGHPQIDGSYFDKEKFAELIVCECASIIESQDVDPSFKNRMSWAMKERFGVEE
jgi:hypothetical protein